MAAPRTVSRDADGAADFAVRSGDRRFDTFSGTLDFAAPEVLRSERYDGKLTDIWAFGVLAYVLICGASPARSGPADL